MLKLKYGKNDFQLNNIFNNYIILILTVKK